MAQHCNVFPIAFIVSVFLSRLIETHASLIQYADGMKPKAGTDRGVNMNA